MPGLGYPFYRLLLCYIIGILLSHYMESYSTIWIWGLAVMITICSITYFLKPFSLISKSFFTLSILVAFTALGALSFSTKKELLPLNHFTQTYERGVDALLVLELKEQLSSNSYNHRFYAEVLAVNGVSTKGQVLVLFKRTDSIDYGSGQVLTVYDDINDASNSRNPGDFNYKEYLKGIDVYGQVYIDQPKVFAINNAVGNSSFFHDFKNKLLDDIKRSHLNKTSQSLIEALILGQRQNLDPTITQNFRDAGVIHILALSGLHVGILLLILQFSTNWLSYLPYGKFIQTAIILTLLWGFAVLTGMSPSILRAVSMFSFVAIGMALNRKGSVFHSLTISAFVLLFYDPRLLFQVGFQLSYTAVIAIVLIQPILSRLIKKPKFWFTNKLWQLATVTIAAQIGVAPLSIFYFHQLPLGFLAGNLILLLFLPMILGLSLGSWWK